MVQKPEELGSGQPRLRRGGGSGEQGEEEEVKKARSAVSWLQAGSRAHTPNRFHM